MTTRVSLPHRLIAPVAVAGAGALACVAVWFADPTTSGGIIPVCPSKFLLGINCPGCGSSRMLYSLLHGDIPAAVHYNALALLALVVLLGTYVFWARDRVRDQRTRRWYQRHRAPQVVLALVLGWLVVRNIPVAPFTSLRV
ncbi:DUF2752 domain-containing protein [Nocardia puris]|uniref:Uncharacterized protein DUF2752 n=1 Tax=Nocardia puris TaxID=208602 RepID=A0A366DVJ8_9NOCA|nr:uncharacterized protein DUF2752 [Nocardia puris]